MIHSHAPVHEQTDIPDGDRVTFHAALHQNSLPDPVGEQQSRSQPGQEDLGASSFVFLLVPSFRACADGPSLVTP